MAEDHAMQTQDAGAPLQEKGNLISPNAFDSKNAHGVTYKMEDGYVTIEGVAERSSFVEIMGDTNIIPESLSAGDWVKLRIQSGTNYISLGIRAFNEENPDGIWLVKTSTEEDFVMPDLSGYTGISVRINTTASDQNWDVTLYPELVLKEKNAYSQPLLTIIDDDGDKHFMMDVLPLIEELGVPIATAVTTTRVGSANRWMNWEDIAECKKRGAEVLCHTYNHPTGTQAATIQFAELCRYNNMALDAMRQHGIDCNGIVYSSSSGYIADVQRAARDYFKYGIVIGGSQINRQYSNPYALTRYRIDYAETEGRTDWNYDDMCSFIDEVAMNGGWQIWMFHTSNGIWRQRVCLDVNGNIMLDEKGNPIPMTKDDGTAVYDNDGTYPTMGKVVYTPMLRAAILYAQSQGVHIVTAQQGYDAYFGGAWR